jgi:hypothetical protein
MISIPSHMLFRIPSYLITPVKEDIDPRSVAQVTTGNFTKKAYPFVAFLHNETVL